MIICFVSEFTAAISGPINFTKRPDSTTAFGASSLGLGCPEL
jgi:hypothetical protein